MKKNYFLRAAGALLLVGVLLLGGVGGTVARFSESAEATPQKARVAAFRVLVDNKVLGESSGGGIDVDLFNAIYTHNGIDTYQENDYSGISPQTGQAADPSIPVRDPVIAPGNGGQFAVEVENLSEVPIKYTISVDGSKMENDDIPVEFRVKKSDGSWDAWVNYKFTNVISVDGTLNPGQSASNAVLIQWRWSYENGLQTNEDDTGMGILERAAIDGGNDGRYQLSVPIKATATQLD